ncbi:Cet1 mRNA 5'-triphosphatase [Candida orthopsilosis Co 90-125]|uniref:mRNA-capping enzyme subunit beta n=1 Tax=Candida orthopsilosis (strain 90-125) TaxID=1136231 RepID=H8WVP8_CANO9|nr:Cet1 mRNA 5'-triphosphatase [Candida orthopsilosis Co 90-125]CCG20521.1 Cet1 mRNA 5'-triphosphatase [Candida orthopsilosis Co 90-125]
MNVGSILNDDPPQSGSQSSHQQTQTPSGHNSSLSQRQQPRQPPSSCSSSQSVHQRHSITNMLNDTTQEDVSSKPHEQVSQQKSVPQQSPQQPPAQPMEEFRKPFSSSAMSSPVLTQRPNPIHMGSSSAVSSSRTSPNTSKRNSIANLTNPEDAPAIRREEADTNHSAVKHTESKICTEPVVNPDDDDLTKIKKIKQSNKPKRYDTPPIWAQRWVPPNARGPGDVNNGAPNVSSDANGLTRVSSKPVFDRTVTNYVDLQCSITGVIPPSSMTRTIAEWVYANFANIEDSNRQNVELELKFGKIIDKRTGNRINLNVITECIYTNDSDIRFDMEVEEIAWNDVRKMFDELEKRFQEEKKTDPSIRDKRKFSMLESDQTDSFYQIGNKNEHLRKVRISKDNLLQPPRYTAIQKERIADLYIHNPQSMYDLRLSLSLEVPVPEGNIESIMAKNQPQLTRDKKRVSFTHTPTITQFDLTRVMIPREFKNKAGKKVVNHEIKYEVEMEADTLEIFQSIDKVRQGTDTFRLEEVVEIFLNNARVINNRVTKLAL